MVLANTRGSIFEYYHLPLPNEQPPTTLTRTRRRSESDSHCYGWPHKLSATLERPSGRSPYFDWSAESAKINFSAAAALAAAEAATAAAAAANIDAAAAVAIAVAGLNTAAGLLAAAGVSNWNRRAKYTGAAPDTAGGIQAADGGGVGLQRVAAGAGRDEGRFRGESSTERVTLGRHGSRARYLRVARVRGVGERADCCGAGA
jgi:hypothetical protein